VNKHHRVRVNLLHFCSFSAGIALLIAVKSLTQD
jgi:hypothetical protein